jgi:hypothetical protein
MMAIRAGAPEDGLRWLQSAIREDPRHVPSLKALAFFHQQSGDPARAARYREQARQAEAASKKPPTASATIDSRQP